MSGAGSGRTADMSDATDEPQDAAEALDGDKVADDEVFQDDDIVVTPPDEPMAVEEYGVTPAEEIFDEPLAERVAREVPDRQPVTDGEEVGRLVEPDEGARTDVEDETLATAAGERELSAEEAAVHRTAAPPMGDGDGYLEDEA